MDSLDAIDKLAELARADRAPAGDVGDLVLSRIRHERGLRRFRRNLAAACALAASLMLVVGLWYGSQSPDPLAELYEVPEIALPW